MGEERFAPARDDRVAEPAREEKGYPDEHMQEQRYEHGDRQIPIGPVVWQAPQAPCPRGPCNLHDRHPADHKPDAAGVLTLCSEHGR